MPTYDFRFIRIVFISKPPNIGTSALNSLNSWAAARPERFFDVLEDDNADNFVARVSWEDDDDTADFELARHCEQYQLGRELARPPNE